MATRSEEVTRLLQGIIGQMRVDLATRQPGGAPYVQSPYTPTKPFGTLAEKSKPSVASRIIDVISRPLYATAETFQTGIENPQADLGEMAGAAWRGFSGKDKTMFGDVLETAGMEEGPAKTALGFAGDVLLDPTTYIPGIGLLKAAGAGGKAIQKSQGALREVEQATKQSSDEMIARAAGVNPVEVSKAQSAATSKFQLPQAAPVAKPSFRDLPERLQTAGAPQAPVAEFPRVQLPGMKEARETAGRETLQAPTTAVPNRFRNQPVEEALPDFLSQQRRAMQKITPEVEGAREAEKILAGRLSTKPLPEPAISPQRASRATEIAEDFLKHNKHKNINEVGQQNLLNKVLNDVNKSLATKGIKSVQHPRFDAARYGTAFEMMRVAEEAIEAAGRSFKVSGKEVRTSEIMNEVGIKEFVKNKSWKDAINAFATGDVSKISDKALRSNLDEILRNRATLQADVANTAMDQVLVRNAELEKSAIAARAKQNKDSLAEALGDIRKQALGVAGDPRGSKSFLKKLLEPDSGLTMSAVQAQAQQIMKQVALGKVDPENIIKVNKAVYESLGGKPKILGQIVGNNRAFESVMTRFATWWGAKDLRPFQREALDTARIGAAAFTQAWAPVVRATTPEMRVSAWRAAQGGLAPASELEAKVAQQFTDAMEKLFHSPALADNAAMGRTVALRAGITLDEMNDALKATGTKEQFTNASKVADKYGKAHDFSKNADWLKSWTVMDVEDPVEFLYRSHLALQRTTRTNSMLDDMVARWGSPVKTGEFRTRINHDRIRDFYFPKEISEQANTLIKSTTDPANYKASSGALKIYDKVLGAFKSGVTIYSPSHHIRNLIGDVWLGALDGVITPGPYLKATRVLATQRSRYQGMQGVMEITDPDALKRAMTRPGDTIVTTKGKQQLTADQIYTAAFNEGILPKASQLEDIIETGGRLVPDVLGGRVRQTAHGVSEIRDHYARLGHFIHVLQTSKTKNIGDLFQEAGRRVKHYHPDGMDMTEFERTVMRRVVPFYSWIRKSMPLMFEAMVQRPGLVTVYPKGMAELQSQFGIEPASGMGDPFPVDQMFPDWIREKGIGPLGDPEAGGISGFIASLARQDPEGYAMLNPSTPFNDSIGEWADPGAFLKSSLSPVASVPLSLYSGKNPLGIPIDNPIEYTAQQAIPPFATGQRLTGMNRPDEAWTPEQLIRWATAAGLIGTGPYIKQAEYEEKYGD